MRRTKLLLFAVLAVGCGQGATPEAHEDDAPYFGNALHGELAFPVRSAWLAGRMGGGADNRASAVTLVLTDVSLSCRDEPLDGTWPSTAHRLRLTLADNAWLQTGHVIQIPGDSQDGGADSTWGLFDHQTFTMHPAEDGGQVGSFDLRLFDANGSATITSYEEPPFQWGDWPTTQIAGSFEVEVAMPNGTRSQLTGSFDAGFCTQ